MSLIFQFILKHDSIFLVQLATYALELDHLRGVIHYENGKNNSVYSIFLDNKETFLFSIFHAAC